ncbi:MAG TPA: hypothetical protein PKY30_12585 [Myxococcota bacterium]|nr:hypothetical protein [Myxococcota bacterium]
MLLLLACVEPGPLSALGSGYADLALEDASFGLYTYISAASLGAEACAARKAGDDQLENHVYVGVGSRLLEDMQVDIVASGDGNLKVSYAGLLMGEPGILSLTLDTSGNLPFSWEGAHVAEGSYAVGRCESETGVKLGGGGSIGLEGEKADHVDIPAESPLLLMGGEPTSGLFQWTNADSNVTLVDAAEGLGEEGWSGTAAGTDWLGEVLLPLP